MSILIPGMEMPTSCMLCSFCAEEADPANGEMCMVTGTLMPPCTRERLDNCPLIPVPDHGRCIDADALAERFWDGQCYFTDAIKSKLQSAPTIIPADKEGEG